MATFAADAGAATNPVAATSAAADPLALRVLLSPAEANVCALLAATAARFSRQAGGGQAVTVRIVGGWVRDKLLGGDVTGWGRGGGGNSRDCEGSGDGGSGGGSNGVGGGACGGSGGDGAARHHPLDMDTAVCGGSPWTFAAALHATAVAATPPPHPPPPRRPPRSKAHPTVTLKVRGVHVDVTSLRGGRVEAQDGVPHALPASAAAADNHAAADAGAVAVTAAWAADAAARDLTLNALFVDPSTRVVTDPTRRGVAAAAARLAATPATAAATLGADPRRALRVARLAPAARLAVDDAIPPAAAAVAAPSLAAIVAEGGKAAAAVAREVDALVSLGGGRGVRLATEWGVWAAALGEEDGGVVAEDGEGEGKRGKVPPWVAGCAIALDAYEG